MAGVQVGLMVDQVAGTEVVDQVAGVQVVVDQVGGTRVVNHNVAGTQAMGHCWCAFHVDAIYVVNEYWAVTPTDSIFRLRHLI